VAQVIIFTGLQGSGKTSYFNAHFAGTHVLVSRDLLRTAERVLQQRHKADLGKRAATATGARPAKSFFILSRVGYVQGAAIQTY
jgi:predicted kinase